MSKTFSLSLQIVKLHHSCCCEHPRWLSILWPFSLASIALTSLCKFVRLGTRENGIAYSRSLAECAGIKGYDNK